MANFEFQEHIQSILLKIFGKVNSCFYTGEKTVDLVAIVSSDYSKRQQI